MTKYCPQLLQEAFGDTLPPLPDNHKLGSSSKRTKKQQQEAKKKAMQLVHSFPPTSILAYTDGGTHLTNPGPSGSGIHIPPSSNFPGSDHQIPLGKGTNNLGELAAIGNMLLPTFLATTRREEPPSASSQTAFSPMAH